MEYYDSINNSMIYLHYNQKNASVLSNPDVISELDKTKNLKEIINSKIEIFKKNENPYKFVSNDYQNLEELKKNILKRNTMIENFDDSRSNDMKENIKDNMQFNPCIDENKEMELKCREVRNYSVKNRHQRKTSTKKINNDKNKKEIKNVVENLDNKLNKIENILTKEIDNQMISFDERKKMKYNKMLDKQRRTKRFQVRRGSKLDDILIAIVSQGESNKEVQQNEILKGIIELYHRKILNSQALMMKEIEDFIEKNLSQMHKALEEVRVSIQEEINNVDEEVFPEVVKGLREDEFSEIENLREQYEEQRREGIEKIKLKYKNIK